MGGLEDFLSKQEEVGEQESMVGGLGAFLFKQEEVAEQEREDLVVWLRQVCEEESVQIEVFCLAVNCVDRFLAVVPLKLSQLQLLGSACLMVAWKVREDRQIRVETILKYSNYNIKADELLEWEMLVLARLHWNINPTTSSDHLPALVNSLHRLQPPLPGLGLLLPLVRPLLPICAQNYKLARLPPSLQASVALLAALKPFLQMPPPSRLLDTPPSSELSSSPSTSSSSSSAADSSPEISPIKRRESARQKSTARQASSKQMEKIISKVQRFTSVDKSMLTSCLERLEETLQPQILPSSPSSSPLSSFSPSLSTPSPSSSSFSSSGLSSSGVRFSTSSPLPCAARTLFIDMHCTPTKLLDVAK